MSRTARNVTLTIATLGVAVVAFMVLRPSDEQTPATQATTTVATTPAPAPQTTTRSASPTASIAVPKPTLIALQDGLPVSGVERVKVRKGEVVRLKVTSDRTTEIHVHGYEIERTAAPGAPASFRFRATIEGRFEVEAHLSSARIADLTVNP